MLMVGRLIFQASGTVSTTQFCSQEGTLELTRFYLMSTILVSRGSLGVVILLVDFNVNFRVVCCCLSAEKHGILHMCRTSCGFRAVCTKYNHYLLARKRWPCLQRERKSTQPLFCDLSSYLLFWWEVACHSMHMYFVRVVFTHQALTDAYRNEG